MKKVIDKKTTATGEGNDKPKKEVFSLLSSLSRQIIQYEMLRIIGTSKKSLILTEELIDDSIKNLGDINCTMLNELIRDHLLKSVTDDFGSTKCLNCVNTISCEKFGSNEEIEVNAVAVCKKYKLNMDIFIQRKSTIKALVNALTIKYGVGASILKRLMNIMNGLERQIPIADT